MAGKLGLLNQNGPSESSTQRPREGGKCSTFPGTKPTIWTLVVVLRTNPCDAKLARHHNGKFTWPKKFHQWTKESLTGGPEGPREKIASSYSSSQPRLGCSYRRRDRLVFLHLYRLKDVACGTRRTDFCCRLANTYGICLPLFHGPCGVRALPCSDLESS